MSARAPITGEEIARARRTSALEIENAFKRGFRSGSEQTLATLEEANCFTTSRAKRFASRLRRQIGDERA